MRVAYLKQFRYASFLYMCNGQTTLPVPKRHKASFNRNHHPLIRTHPPPMRTLSHYCCLAPYMRYLFLLFFYMGSFVPAHAQEETGGAPPRLQIAQVTNSIYGRIQDWNSNTGLEAISVQLYRAATPDSLITAMLTLPNGDFRFENLPPADSFRLIVTGIGYARQEQWVVFAAAGPGNAVAKDLGNIILQPDAQVLSAVVVTSEKQALVMGIDRRVFNVDQSLTATGGTATDVMKNIPSVTVDVDGNVTLRNSTPQIFVDGRPTILTLDQIPANDIERVELITNPSAKFDAASTGGIINVVMKRNKKVGINGIFSAGVGYPGILNSNLSINVRQNKFNFFATGSYNQSGGRATGKTFRQNKRNGLIEDYFNQVSEEERTRRFTAARFGADFFMDNRNTFSLTQGFVQGKFDNAEVQDQQFLDINQVPERFGKRSAESENKFYRYNTQLNYAHKFPQDGKELTANINYNYGKGNSASDILNSFFNPDGSLLADPSVVKNRGDNNNNQVTLQLDYVQPKDENTKLETGLRSYINNFSNRFDARSVNNGVETPLALSNNIEYREIVNAFYVTYSKKINTFSYQAGLRAEHSKFAGKLLDTGKEFGYDYPSNLERIFDALFPSLFLTKTISEGKEMQLNYSRRIRRPNFWQLNPFVNINDPLNISQGNPELKPEFTNSLEFNYSQQYKQGNFLASVYYRNTQGDITRYSDTISTAQFQQLNEAAIAPNAILNTFINAQQMNRLGAEFTVQHKIGEFFDITPTINGEYQVANAKVGNLDLGNEGFNWEAKLIANYKIVQKKPSFFNNLGFQLIGEYESPRIMPQGYQIPEFSVDMAIRKDFLKKKKASLTLSANDIFWTNRDGSVFDTESFYQESNRRNIRSFRLTFSYKFGDAEFKLFNQRGNDGGDD